uniref:Transmembrane protein (PGPGW) n=1 Tax=uncultured Armatimonadetes bacterium TaxID=157466 RepID=A0A6J4IHH1_9BACT|nr:hypothetical protein AVDCRST_MAG63-1956 [uncultured Armatimonadetes bacterium]
MRERIQAAWESFRACAPGTRCQERYWRRREAGGRAGTVRRVFGGLAVVALGVVLIPLPGPGGLIILFGLALVGGEVLPLARLLDWAEVWARAVWAVTPGPAKKAAHVLLLAGFVLALYTAFRLVLGAAR